MYIEKIKSCLDSFLEGPLLLKPKKYEDERGFFFESFNQREINNILSENVNFVQDNHSCSKKGILRGLHYQLSPYAQGKLVRVTKGCIYDVIVDIRKNSKTFSHWAGLEISDINNNQIWIPEGFAHGFLTLTDLAEVQYKTTQYWNKSCERSLIWNDKEINITWPLTELSLDNPILSEKDTNAKSLIELSYLKDLL